MFSSSRALPPGNGARGATHTAELPYAFINLIGSTAWTDLDRQLADTMTSYWVNFAANGDPNGKGSRSGPRIK
jgi:para-nitrobenzyl esterase